MGGATHTTDGLPESWKNVWVTPKWRSSLENDRPAAGCQMVWMVVRPSHSNRDGVMILRSSGIPEDSVTQPNGANDSAVMGSMARR